MGLRLTNAVRCTVAGLALAAVALLPAPALALTDLLGNPIPDTAAGGEFVSGSMHRLLAAPETPADDDPAALAALGTVGSPEDDLGAALDAMAAAPSVAAADAARRRALDILVGNAVPGAAYSGIPLLNYNAPAKVKDVPAGGNVVVREVRFGEHALTDTWLLRFADPSLPYTITYRVSELGFTGVGGVLSPTPLLSDGGVPVGGINSALQPLAIDNQLTGTNTPSRFGPAGLPEQSRLAEQDLTVTMPPPHLTRAVLEPNLQPGRATLATLAPATPERIAAAARAFGFSGTPSGAQRDAAILRIGARAPERIVWNDLRILDPAAGDFLPAVQAIGRDDRQLVYEMQTRSAPPSGVDPGPDSNINVVLLNDEAYTWAGQAQFTPGSTLTVTVTNADGFSHDVQALDLHHKQPVGLPTGADVSGPGRANTAPLDFGQFSWDPLELGQSGALAPGATRTFELTLAPATFGVWVGDDGSGDQAATLCRIAGNGTISCPSDEVAAVRHTVAAAPAPAAPSAPAGPAPGGVTPAVARDCATKWLVREKGVLRVLLLGEKARAVTTCLGVPARRVVGKVTQRWSYRGGLDVMLKRGRVTELRLRGGLLRGPSNLGVGSRVSVVRSVLPQSVYERQGRVFRAVLVHAKGTFADVRLGRSKSKPARVTHINVRLRTRGQLDRVGRDLLRTGRQ